MYIEIAGAGGESMTCMLVYLSGRLSICLGRRVNSVISDLDSAPQSLDPSQHKI